MTAPPTLAKSVCYTALLSSLVLLLFIFSLLSRVTPWADEWFMLALTPMGFAQWVGWLFQQHNDHVILFQKLLQGGLIRLSGYDFRSLVLINMLMIAGAAWAMLRVAEEYRGRHRLLDVVIVLALCCVGPNAVVWSSTFAFPATNLVLAAFALTWMRTINAGPTRWRALVAALLLVSGPFIAAGGAVATTVLCMFLWALRAFRKDVVQPLPLLGLVVATAANARVWVLYRPSSAAGVDPSRVPDFVVGLNGSSIYWWGLPYEPLKDILCTMFVAACIVCCILVVLRRSPDPKELVLAGTIAAVFAVMGSIAIGRSAFTAWHPGLKTHYGLVSALLIPSGLLLLERRWRFSAALSGVFAVLLGVSYVLAFKYQVGHLKSVRAANMAALHRLAHSSDLPRDLAGHWPDYWWRDADKELAPELARRVEFIRQHGGGLYQPWTAP